MGQFTVPNQEQAHLARSIGLNPEQFTVLLDNERSLVMLHLKTRSEVLIVKNRRNEHGSQ